MSHLLSCCKRRMVGLFLVWRLLLLKLLLQAKRPLHTWKRHGIFKYQTNHQGTITNSTIITMNRSLGVKALIFNLPLSFLSRPRFCFSWTRLSYSFAASHRSLLFVAVSCSICACACVCVSARLVLLVLRAGSCAALEGRWHHTCNSFWLMPPV